MADRSEEIEDLGQRVADLRDKAKRVEDARPRTTPGVSLKAVETATELEAAIQRNAAMTQSLQQSAASMRSENEVLQAKLIPLLADLAVVSNETAALQASLAKAVKARGVAFLPERASVKRPILIECDEGFVRSGRLEGGAVPRVHPMVTEADVKAFVGYVADQSKVADYFVLLVKPKGIATFGLCRSIIVGMGFDLGWDALEQDRTIIFGGGTRDVTPR